MSRNFLLVDPEGDGRVLHALASPVRTRILRLLHARGSMNINDVSTSLGLPQSTISSNIQLLVECGLVATEARKARKGNQKICRAIYDEVLVVFRDELIAKSDNTIEVSMPLGLYTSCEVSSPCGLCSSEGIVGLLDVPGTFLDPGRMNARLMWFTRGFIEYQFPNNARLSGGRIEALEFSAEVSSEVPGTSADWPSDITVSINGREIGTWTSPGDFGDRRGVFTPGWWKLKGSQYGKLKTWRVTAEGSFIDGVRISAVSLSDLDLASHHSVRVRIGVPDSARHPGGINIFGRGFGNYDQDLVLRLVTATAEASAQAS